MWVRFDDQGCPAWFGPVQVEGSEWVDGVNERVLLTMRRVAGEWVAREHAEPKEPTAEEIEAHMAEQAAAERAADDAARKMRGVEFEGVMCSATRDDQNGLTAVLLRIQMKGAAFKPTRFEFVNGSTLVIHLGNYAAFAAVWSDFRESFFPAT